MPHYLQYWKLEQTEIEMLESYSLEHSAGEQLNKINIGDVVWIISIRSGKLFVVGRMDVGECIGYREAKRRFGVQVWKAKYHIVAAAGTTENLREVCVMDIVESLRFDSPTGKNCLKISNNRVDGKQLQKMRKLTSETAALIESKWYKTEKPDTAEIEYQILGGTGFGDASSNKKVEKSAVDFVTEQYKKEGWRVKSVEAEKCGFDLLCRKNGTEQHVEVKGISGSEISFIITANEVKQAENNSKFVICAVTSATSETPKLNRYSGQKFIKDFKLNGLAYKAVLNKTI